MVASLRPGDRKEPKFHRGSISGDALGGGSTACGGGTSGASASSADSSLDESLSEAESDPDPDPDDELLTGDMGARTGGGGPTLIGGLQAGSETLVSQRPEKQAAQANDKVGSEGSRGLTDPCPR